MCVGSSHHRRRQGSIMEPENPFPFDLILEGRWHTIVRLCGSKKYEQPEPAPIFLPAVLLELLRERRRVEQAKGTEDNVMEGVNDVNLQECLLEAIVRFGESDCIEEYAMAAKAVLDPCGPYYTVVSGSSCSEESPSAMDFQLAFAEDRVMMVLGELKKALIALENGSIQEDMTQPSQSDLLCQTQLEPDFVLLLPVILSQRFCNSFKPSLYTCNVTASLVCTSSLAPSLVSCLALNDPTTLNDTLQGILKVWHLHPVRAAEVAVELAKLSPSAARMTRLRLMQVKRGVTLPACIRISTTILCDPERFVLMASPDLLCGLVSNTGCIKSLIAGMLTSLSSTVKLDDFNGQRVRKHCFQALCRLSEHRVSHDDTLELFGSLVERFKLNGQVCQQGLAPLIVITACVVAGPHNINHLESALNQVASSTKPLLAILALILVRERRFQRLFSIFSKISGTCALPQQKIDTNSWETAATAISQTWTVCKLTDLLFEAISMPLSEHGSSSLLLVKMECIVVALSAGYPIIGQTLRNWVIRVVDIGLTLHPLPSVLLELIESVARACCAGKEKEGVDVPDSNAVPCIPPFMPKAVTASLKLVKWERYFLYFAKDGFSVACQEHDRGKDHQPPPDLCRALLHLYFALCYVRIGSEIMEPFYTPFFYDLRSLPLRRPLQAASSIPCLRAFHTKLLKEIHACAPELFCPVRVMKDSCTSPWTNLRCRRLCLEDRYHGWDEVWSEQAAAADVLCHSSFSIGNNPNIAVSVLQCILNGHDDALLQRGEAIIRSVLPTVCDALDDIGSSSNTTMKREQLDVPLSLLSSLWHRLHTMHACPQVLEALTINILLQRERRIGISRAYSFRTLFQEPLLVFRCRPAAFSNYQTLSIVLSCLRSLLLASKQAILQAARHNSFIHTIENASPSTLCPGSAAATTPVSPSLPSDGSAAKGSNVTETSGPSFMAVSGAGNAFAGNNPPPTDAGSSSQLLLQPTKSRFVAPQMMLQVQGLIVTRCVLNICDGAMGANVQMRTLFHGCPNPCNTMPVARSLILESGTGFLQMLFAEDPTLPALLLDQTFPLRWMSILLHCVPAFVLYASPCLADLLACNSLEKLVFCIQVSALFAEVHPSLSVVKSVCREAFKAAASIEVALGPDGPDNALYLLEDISQSLASIGGKYPEFAAGIASLLMRINNKLQGGEGGVGNKSGGTKDTGTGLPWHRKH